LIADIEFEYIQEIHSEVDFAGGNLFLQNRLTLDPDNVKESTVKFYLPSKHILSHLKITDEHGKKLKYRARTMMDISLIEVENDENNQTVIVDYHLDLSKTNSSIAYFRDDNQYFILPENSIFPRNNVGLKPDNIHYTVKVTESASKYSYAKESLPGNFSMPPCIIFGNFKIEQYKGVQVYIPADIEVNKERLDYIVSSISDSYNYYSEVFGKSILSQDIKVFFLNRRGGYTFQDGIILNQKYISGNNSFANDEITGVVAHETAHLWWGTGVMTKSFAITEGLAEFSSNFYLTDNEKQSFNIYSYKNSIVALNTSVKPANIDSLNVFDENYKTIAYSKLPVIFHEAELKIGRDDVLKALKSFYTAEKQSSKLCGFENIVSHFPTDYQDELRKDVDGTLENWPDFYVRDVSGNTVVFKGDHIHFGEIVPVELTTDKNEIIRDTLYFDAENNEIEKCYNNDILKIIIDSDFSTNQSVLLNDLWSKDTTSLLDNKFRQTYEPEYRIFFDTLLNYLFTKEDVSIVDMIDRKNVSFLSEGKKKLKEANVKAHGSCIKINTKSRYFKIVVTYSHKDGFENGYIEGLFYEQDNSLRLKSFKRIKI
jgi:hypothetical protein